MGHTVVRVIKSVLMLPLHSLFVILIYFRRLLISRITQQIREHYFALYHNCIYMFIKIQLNAPIIQYFISYYLQHVSAQMEPS